MRLWFNRKPRNRRLAREFVLDVKLRSSKVRAMRARMAAVALGAVFATVIGIYVLWRTGEWALDQLVYENPSFAVREVEVQTDGVIALDQLQRWSGVKPGQNLLALDLARVKRDLELIPAVESVAVERVLPHTVRIRVVEREPVAQINLPRRRPDGRLDLAVFQLDPAGYVMVPLEARQRATPVSQADEQLPLISGLNLNDVQTGRKIDSPQVRAALELIAAFGQSPMAGLVDLKRIDISSPEVLAATTDTGGEITFGLERPDLQLRRWREIFDSGQRLSRAIASLDLAVTNNIPVRWLEASAVPAPSPKVAKPSRYKKKNV